MAFKKHNEQQKLFNNGDTVMNIHTKHYGTILDYFYERGDIVYLVRYQSGRKDKELQEALTKVNSKEDN